MTVGNGGARAAVSSKPAGSRLNRALQSRGHVELPRRDPGIGASYRRWRWMTTASTMMTPLRMA
jgi:hypothetical protein